MVTKVIMGHRIKGIGLGYYQTSYVTILLGNIIIDKIV